MAWLPTEVHGKFNRSSNGPNAPGSLRSARTVQQCRPAAPRGGGSHDATTDTNCTTHPQNDRKNEQYGTIQLRLQVSSLFCGSVPGVWRVHGQRYRARDVHNVRATERDARARAGGGHRARAGGHRARAAVAAHARTRRRRRQCQTTNLTTQRNERRCCCGFRPSCLWQCAPVLEEWTSCKGSLTQHLSAAQGPSRQVLPAVLAQCAVRFSCRNLGWVAATSRVVSAAQRRPPRKCAAPRAPRVT